MEVERALQADHPDWMRVVASFADGKTGERVCDELGQKGLVRECRRLQEARVGIDRPRLKA